jgi:protein-S-isoprenylcysteine O-methyltransferase Ste14
MNDRKMACRPILTSEHFPVNHIPVSSLIRRTRAGIVVGAEIVYSLSRGDMSPRLEPATAERTMTDAMRQPESGNELPHSNRAMRRGFISFAVFFFAMAASMFLSAGRFDWTPGWVFLAVSLVVAVVAVAYLWRTNPEVLVARSEFHWRDQTPAHKLIFILLIVLFMAIFPIAGLDAGRYGWSAVPPWPMLTGYALMLIGDAGVTWVMKVNKFAEPSVSIQADRGHQVIDTGPYSIVRHPFYASTIFLCLGTPLALCSYWAFVPSALAYLALVVRTALEDRLLQNELVGYKEYAARVRYRLLPGVW